MKVISMLAILTDAPEIAGPLPLKEPGFVDSAWFWPSLGAALLLAMGLIIFQSGRLLERRRALAARSPDCVLRARVNASRGMKPGAPFFRELAAILREALAYTYDIDAARLTARELEGVIAKMQQSEAALTALGMLRDCELALFSGAVPENSSEWPDRAQGILDALQACGREGER